MQMGFVRPQRVRFNRNLLLLAKDNQATDDRADIHCPSTPMKVYSVKSRRGFDRLGLLRLTAMKAATPPADFAE